MPFVTLTEVKVGLLVLLALVLLLVLTFSIGNFQDFFSHTVLVSITIPSVVGLDNFSPVTYSGVRIGTVTRIRYDESLERAVIEAKIDIDSPVSIDSKAHFTSAGLLSPLFVEISGGSKEKRLRDLLRTGVLDPQNIYLDAEPYLSFGEIFSVAGNIKGVLKKVEDLLDGVGGLPPEIAGFITEVSRETQHILRELDGTLVEGRPRVITTIDQMNGLIRSASEQAIPALENLRKGSASIPGLMGDTRQKLSAVLNKTAGLIDSVSPDLDTITDESLLLIQDLRQQVESLHTAVLQLTNHIDSMVVDNQEDIHRIVSHLERTSANLNEISNEIKKNPWRLFWKSEEKLPPGHVSPKWNPVLENPSK